jgi:hypothetical protein
MYRRRNDISNRSVIRLLNILGEPYNENNFLIKRLINVKYNIIFFNNINPLVDGKYINFMTSNSLLCAIIRFNSFCDKFDNGYVSIEEFYDYGHTDSETEDEYQDFTDDESLNEDNGYISIEEFYDYGHTDSETEDEYQDFTDDESLNEDS